MYFIMSNITLDTNTEGQFSPAQLQLVPRLAMLKVQQYFLHSLHTGSSVNHQLPVLYIQYIT